jgi:hypothetical protein
MQLRHHYEQAFAYYLRANRLPYVAVNEARRAILPEGAEVTVAGGWSEADRPRERAGVTLKSFDFVVYGEGASRLVDIKGRKVAARKNGRRSGGRLESWVTRADVEALATWERLFGEGFRGAFVFLYWCEVEPPDGLFQEVFLFESRWYALRAIDLEDYVARMKVRSPRWKTVDLPTASFAEASRPFVGC